MEEAESDEEHTDYDDWSQLQSVVNQVWHDKWKQAVKNSIKINGGMESKAINGIVEKRGRWGPTGESENPKPTLGIL